MEDPIWLRNHVLALEATNAVAPAPAEAMSECDALIHRGAWDAIEPAAKMAVLADPASLVELHHTAWSMRSIRLMAGNRTCVELQPAITDILTGGT